MDLNEKIDFFEHVNCDFLAGFFIALLKEDDPLFPEHEVSNQGSLKRKWSNDIISTEITDFGRQGNILRLNLCRDGIYDSLPEGIFHELSENDPVSGTEMAKDSKRLKKEEQDARLFFKPFEQEIFQQEVNLAEKETELFRKINMGHLYGLKSDFWSFSHPLPMEYKNRLIKLIPKAQFITGRNDLTAQSLEYILQEKVKISIEESQGFTLEESNSNCLGEMSLGTNALIGNYMSNSFGCVKITIGPLMNSRLEDYLENGILKKLTDSFRDYFIPVERETCIIVLLDEENSQFTLMPEIADNKQFLGYNTILS